MADVRAADLPVGSVAATTTRAFIKKIADAGAPWQERYWMAAETYAVQTTDQQMQSVMDRDGAKVLRVGDGTAGER